MTPFGKHGPWRRGALAALVLAASPASPAFANPASPSLKPRDAYGSQLVDAAEFSRLRTALDAADAGRWSDARTAAARLTDPAARLLMAWRITTDSSAASTFAELEGAKSALAGWPGSERIAAQAEAAIALSGLGAAQQIAWLRAAGPTTSDGLVALAEAHRRAGELDVAVRLVREAWRSRPLSSDAARTILETYGAHLSQDDHWRRVDLLLFRGDRSAAQALSPRLSVGRRALVEARLALSQNRKGVDALVAAVPAEYAADPGLLLERAKWRERRRDDAGAREMLDLIRGIDAAEAGREAIWREKHPVVRRLLRERDDRGAYALTLDHGLTEGEGFRDAEWTAGWIALTRLGDARAAEGHFRSFGAGVATPISRARAAYWLAEALSAQSRNAEAIAAYRAAAEHSFVFYGQLAAEKLARLAAQPAVLALPPSAPPTDADRTAFEARPVVRAAMLLAETRRRGTFERFIIDLDDLLTTPADHQMLFDIASRYLEPRAALRTAKAGLQRGLVAPEAAYPLIDLPASPGSGAAEPALVLALSRQESEFNPRAVSSAGARGLMQLMPRTAQAEARNVGAPYRLSWLTDDPTYNMRLGRNHLDGLIEQFGGSYLLAAAAYNAGASRVNQWIAEFGDPRTAADPVDWVESIPFSETRNYVQRVLENLQVYRHRLSGEPTPIQITRDMQRVRR